MPSCFQNFPLQVFNICTYIYIYIYIYIENMTFCQVMSSGSVNCVLFVICPPCFQNFSLDIFNIYLHIYICIENVALYCVMIGDPVARFQNFSFYVFNVYTHKCIYIYCVMIGDPVTHWNYVVCPPCFQNFRFQKFCIAVTQSLLRRACLICLIFFFCACCQCAL